MTWAIYTTTNTAITFNGGSVWVGASFLFIFVFNAWFLGCAIVPIKYDYSMLADISTTLLTGLLTNIAFRCPVYCLSSVIHKLLISASSKAPLNTSTRRNHQVTMDDNYNVLHGDVDFSSAIRSPRSWTRKTRKEKYRRE